MHQLSLDNQKEKNLSVGDPGSFPGDLAGSISRKARPLFDPLDPLSTGGDQTFRFFYPDRQRWPDTRISANNRLCPPPHKSPRDAAWIRGGAGSPGTWSAVVGRRSTMGPPVRTLVSVLRRVVR